MNELHISILYGDESLEAIPSEGYFLCPLCPDTAGSYSEEGYLDHVASVHSKSKLIFEDFTILKCHKGCLTNRRRGHYHCPQCAKVIFSRGDLVYHLKAHEAKKGKKSKRGRRKGLSSVLQNTNTEVELFNSITCVVSAQILSMFRNMEEINEYFADISSKYDVQCYIPKGGWCIIQGKWKGVSQAKCALEELAVKAIEKEKARAKTPGFIRLSAPGPSSEAVAGGGEGPQQAAKGEGAEADAVGAGGEGGAPDVGESPEAGEDDPENPGRRSGRKRKLNQKYSEEFQTPKKSKGEAGAEGDGAAEEEEDNKDDSEAKIVKLLSRTQQDVKIQFAEETNFGGLSMTVVLTKPELIAEEVILPVEASSIPDYEVPEEEEEEEDELYKDDTDNDPSVTLNTLQSEESLSGSSHWHMRAEEGDEPVMVEELYTCNACHHQMTGREALGAHVAACTNPAELTLVFKCAGCHVTGDEDSIRSHFVDMHFADLNGCVKCKKIFRSSTALRAHMIQKGHMASRHALAEEPCPICHKSVKVKNLRQHIKQVHEKVKPYGCELCPKKFATKFLAKEHMDSHKAKGEILPTGHLFGCICGQNFQQQHLLKMHQDKCATFVQQQYDNSVAMGAAGQEAASVVMPQQANYQCGYCQQNFVDLETTKQHIAMHIADVEATGPEPTVAVGDASMQQMAIPEGTLQQQIAATGTTLQQMVVPEGTLQQVAAGTLQQIAVSEGTLQQMGVAADAGTVDQSSLQHLALTAVEQQNIQLGDSTLQLATGTGTGQQELGGDEAHLINLAQNGEITQIMAGLPSGGQEGQGLQVVEGAGLDSNLMQVPLSDTGPSAE